MTEPILSPDWNESEICATGLCLEMTCTMVGCTCICHVLRDKKTWSLDPKD